MPTDITASTIVATIPATTDAADIVTAFTAYHTDIGAAINSKANVANPTFTGNVTAPNIISSTTYENVHTITLFGQASSAVKGARYFPSAAASYNPNSATVNQTRIIVSQNTPATANLQTGDVWISWTV